MAFGNEVHALLESVAWIDEGLPALPPTAAGNSVRKLLEDPRTRECFLRQGRDVRLLREQAIDATIEGRWVSGIIDRLHLHRDSGGKVVRVEIIDFKTDAVDAPEELVASYQPQLEAYRNCIRLIHPDALIECMLLSTHLDDIIKL
jgi:ATP-dependent exoDNAse (exonuclease V) beta subunit